jgi:hypothetical protein
MSARLQEVKKRGAMYCSFCGRERGEVQHLLGSVGGAFICEMCVNEAQAIIAREKAGKPALVIGRSLQHGGQS